jgi:hypothetical protein
MLTKQRCCKQHLKKHHPHTSSSEGDRMRDSGSYPHAAMTKSIAGERTSFKTPRCGRAREPAPVSPALFAPDSGPAPGFF